MLRRKWWLIVAAMSKPHVTATTPTCSAEPSSTSRACARRQNRGTLHHSSVLREAVAEGPILFRALDKVHEHILRPDAWAFTE